MGDRGDAGTGDERPPAGGAGGGAGGGGGGGRRGRPLEGLHVVECASFVAGPTGGMTLAQLGADVVRIDPGGGGRQHRRRPGGARWEGDATAGAGGWRPMGRATTGPR